MPQILQEYYFVHKIRLGLKSELYKAKTDIFKKKQSERFQH